MSEVQVIIVCKAHELGDKLAQMLGSLTSEKISVTGDTPKVMVIPETDDRTTATGEEPISDEAEVKTRDEIKGELREMGVEFNEKSPTKNLLVLLVKSRRDIPTTPDEVPQTEPSSDESSSPSGTEESPAYDKEQVRTALVALSDAKGQDIARGILKETGGVDRLSKLPEDKFADVMAEIKKAAK